MNPKELLDETIGKSIVVLGNEAIARGVLEGGVQAVFSYPGTPSSEIMNTLAALSKEVGYYAEFSANEKIAMEGAFAAAMSGIRSLFIAKHVGLNVAMDPLMSAAYMGVRGGMVIISADDPGMWSSQNEQDNRWLGRFGNLLVLTPSDAQEALEFSREAFDISEQFKLPIFLRTTTRVNHSRSNVSLGEIKKQTYSHQNPDRNFERDPQRFVSLPINARINHIKVLNKLKEVEEWANTCKYNRFIEGNGDVGIIASGVSFTYFMEARRELNLSCPVLKIGIDHPLPKKKIIDFINEYKLNKVIIIEENEPVLELGVRAIINTKELSTKIFGKDQGVTPYTGELDIEKIIKGITSVTSLSTDTKEVPSVKPENVVNRPPILCPGCPHRSTFYALNKTTRNRKNTIIATDIGCYTLGYMPPLHIGDSNVCMGASIGVASGWSHSGIKEDIIAVIGDSTFWHAGLTGLVSAIYNKSNMTLLVLDNFTTAMTGMQEHPSTGKLATGDPVHPISIRNVMWGLGLEYIKVTHAFNIKETSEALKEAIAHDGISVVISEGICQIKKRMKKRAGEFYPYPSVSDAYYISPSVCIGCATCATKLACPAISWSDKKTDKGKMIPKIDPTICEPCGVCVQVCPTGAIRGKDRKK